jgi:hypothetical protein
MKTKGTFKHFLNGKELTEEEFQRKIKDIEVIIEVDKLIVKAKRKK